jgi:hypothetical protein
MTSEEIAAIAEDAYVFFFPMLMGYRYAFASFLDPSLPSHMVPLNTLGGEPRTLDHAFKDVITPNADTPYSMAALDLRAEPMVLFVPEVNDRYYVLQFEDLYGTNAHYVGSRATGTAPGTYLLAGPGWDGEPPSGMDAAFRFDTDLVFIIGRTQLLGPDDVEALRLVMDGYDLRPLSVVLGTETPTAPAFDWPVWNEEASRDERFIGYTNDLLELCRPTHPSEEALMARFARIGIAPGAPFDADALGAEQRAALWAGVSDARDRIAHFAENLSEPVNGWTASNAFGDRAWYDGNYLLRAAGAMAGWGGNDTIEAVYPISRQDADGQPLDGDHRYRFRLTSEPPAKAFWSVTMYDTSYDGTAGFLVENPIDRYLINSTTEGLVVGEDGSLTMHIQHDQPGTVEGVANWLPAPEGPFYLVLRIYWPEPAALDGRWTPPPVERV